MSEETEPKPTEKKYHPGALFWIPMIWNGFCLLVFIVVGLTFLWGSRQPVDAPIDPPSIIIYFFALFDMLMIISPLSVIVLSIISIFNVTRARSKTERFLPLICTVLIQGSLAALFLASLTQPAG